MVLQPVLDEDLAHKGDEDSSSLWVKQTGLFCTFPLKQAFTTMLFPSQWIMLGRYYTSIPRPIQSPSVCHQSKSLPAGFSIFWWKVKPQLLKNILTRSQMNLVFVVATDPWHLQSSSLISRVIPALQDCLSLCLGHSLSGPSYKWVIDRRPLHLAPSSPTAVLQFSEGQSLVPDST